MCVWCVGLVMSDGTAINKKLGTSTALVVECVSDVEAQGRRSQKCDRTRVRFPNNYTAFSSMESVQKMDTLFNYL